MFIQNASYKCNGDLKKKKNVVLLFKINRKVCKK